MRATELLDLMNEGYPDMYLATFYDREGKPVRRPMGDGLALFIVLETLATFDPKATDEVQVTEAIRVMETAQKDLDGVLGALRKAAASV